MKKKYMLSACLALSTLCAQADTGETVVINGSVNDGFVTSITFDGDDAILSFADGKTATADMSQVSITLTYDPGDTAIRDVRQENTAAPRVYSVSGQYVGCSTEGLRSGVYIVNGKKVVIR